MMILFVEKKLFLIGMSEFKSFCNVFSRMLFFDIKF